MGHLTKLRIAWLSTLVCVLLVVPVFAQVDQTDLTVISRIKKEAFDNSQVMETLRYLTDVYGPRLTASPEFKEAADWTVTRLRSYDVEHVGLERWGPFGRSWALQRYSLEMLEPRYALLTAAPLAWSGATAGFVTGEVLYAPYGRAQQSLDPTTQQEELDDYVLTWTGKLRGKVVLITPLRDVTPITTPPFRRYTDDELRDRMQAPTPVATLSDVLDLDIPEDPDEAQELIRRLPDGVREQLAERRQAIAARRARFFQDEGALGILNTSRSSTNALIFAQAGGSYDARDTLAPPTFVVSQEQYNRMARLAERDVPVRVRLNLQADISAENQDAYNVVGEIPGGVKASEVVMIGAHLDSWHAGTGATDNAAGSAVMIEVMRILKALHLTLDRTVRIALWSGEEQGLLGSEAYVKEHFGDPETMTLTDAHATLSGYFNLDNGTGKIRGVYLQGNDAMRPIFERWLAPFRDQGVGTVAIRGTGGTDHLSFDAVGLPGFQFIQDPADYGTITHHSQVDTFDHVSEADLMQAAQIIATVVYHAANRPELLPRKPLPDPAVRARSLH